ncbi:MAG: hypothetical protein HDQ87_08045 [Clostridia bacterium]|nr:hypothetical protein [Clostridia bacterium]
MSKRDRLRRLLYFVQWLGFFSFVTLIAVFSVTGWLGIMPPPRSGDSFVAIYGMRPVLLLLFLAACLVDAVCLMFGRFARLQRYPVTLHARNIEVQYLLLNTMLAVLEFVATVYCTLLMVQIYQMEVWQRPTSFGALTAAAAALAALDVVAYLHLAKKNT